MTAAIAVGVLVAAGVYLLLQRGLVRITFGFVLLGHAANVLLLASGGMDLRGVPLIGSGPIGQMADPLPQAFVLTAIVITFGLTVYLLALARSSVGAAEESDTESSPTAASAPPAADQEPDRDGGAARREAG